MNPSYNATAELLAMIEYGDAVEELTNEELARILIEQVWAELPIDSAAAALVSEIADRLASQWESVEYKHIFTPEARLLRPDYATICEKWRYFYDDDCNTDDGYEYEICRRKKATDE
jgi:hypothetical protein